MTTPINTAHNRGLPTQSSIPQVENSPFNKDILGLIFSMLSNQEQQSNFRLVCKKWKIAADHTNPIRTLPLLKKSLFIPAKAPCLCFSGNNTIAYTATINGVERPLITQNLETGDVKTGKINLWGNHRMRPASNGKFLLISGEMHVCDLESVKSQGTNTSHRGVVISPPDPQGRIAKTAITGEVIEIFNQDGELIKSIKDPTNRIDRDCKGLTFQKNELFVAYVSFYPGKPCVKKFSLDQENSVEVLELEYRPNEIAVDEKNLVVSHDHGITIYNRQNFSEKFKLKNHNGKEDFLCLSSRTNVRIVNGNVYAVTTDKKLLVWDSADGSLSRSFTVESNPPLFKISGDLVAFLSSYEIYKKKTIYKVTLLHLSSGKKLCHTFNGKPSGGGMSPRIEFCEQEGNKCLAVTIGEEIKVWHPAIKELNKPKNSNLNETSKSNKTSHSNKNTSTSSNQIDHPTDKRPRKINNKRNSIISSIFKGISKLFSKFWNFLRSIFRKV